MLNKIYHKLEYDTVLEMVALKAHSNYVKDKILKTRHATSYEEVSTQLKQTDEIMQLFIAYGAYSLAGFNDILGLLEKVQQKKILTGLELNDIMLQQEIMERIYQYHNDIDEITKYYYFSKQVNSLTSMLNLAKNINQMISNDGLIYEDATANLVNINREIDNINHKITAYLKGFINKNSAHLMDNVITYRNSRAVVMVKSESKNIIKGIIHDESSSKQTVFIEPSQVVEYNNNLQSLEYDKVQEINTILEGLSKEVLDNKDALMNNFYLLADLDLVRAKANYSLEINGNIPKINQDSAKLEIYRGRHPLIKSEDVIANDFFICNDETKYRIVLISGSNTGGKTVALKMVGLFALMAQSGLAIPASERSNLPIYKKFFVDIGDEQSITESLSTFSAHLTNVANITKHVSKHSLVLLDELGSGTDPREGENLALAILEYLYKKDASIVVTTHYSKLKNYALTTNYVRSASVLFDEKNNRPMYKISFDTFASSNAFEIAQYLGLKKSIVDQARAYYEEDLDTSGELLLKLESMQQDVKQELEKTNREKERYEKLRTELSAKEKALIKTQEKAIERAQQEANNIVIESKREAKKLIDELKKQDNFINHKVNEITKQFDDLIFENDQPTNRDDDHIYQVNDLVEILKLKRQGIISKVLPKGQFEVSIGNIKTKVKKSEIMFLSKYQPEKTTKTKVKRYASKRVGLELNLIGLRVDDALIELAKYLDDALLANLGQVRIVHGFGTGALREAVHDYLRKAKQVKSFEFAKYSEGGQGATIVNLK